MEGQGCDLMEVNGNTGAIEDICSLQRETIPLVHPRSFWLQSDEAMFLEAEEEIGIRQTVHAMGGNVAPIIQEQQELCKEM